MFPWDRRKNEKEERLHRLRNLLHEIVSKKTVDTRHLQQQHNSEELIKALNHLEEQKRKEGGSTYE